MKRVIFAAIALMSIVISYAFAQEETMVLTQDYLIDLDGFTTQAQLMLPADVDEALTLVVLVHGSGAYDMDTTVYENLVLQDEIKSQNFRLIAETLPNEGYAVMRYNKRGVNALGDYDFEQVQASTLDVLVADTNAVIDFALNIDDVQFDQVVLYGWSEGAWVVANVATMRDDITGLVMQGAPNGSMMDIFPYQYFDVALPYLRDVVDTDGDSLLSLDDVATIPQGSTQLVVSSFFYEPNVAFVDTNGDGLIHLDDELEPAMTTFIGNLSFFMPSIEARQDTANLVAENDVPTLLLHGVLDGWVPVTHSQAISDAAPDTVTLHTYEELGHALSITDALAEDGFGVMVTAPFEDLTTWLDSLD